MKKALVLGYHSIEKPCQEPGAKLYCVTEQNFKKQVEYISRTAGNTKAKITITFDDGDITNYLFAHPILKKAGLKASFFIIAGFIGKEGYMNFGQIRELRNAGHTIGSHGMSHRILTLLSDDEMRYELMESKKLLEEGLNEKICGLSIPRAFYSKKVIRAALDTGYKDIYISDFCDYSYGEMRAFGRILVKNNWDFEYFKRVIEKGIPLRAKVKERAIGMAKRILGAGTYDKIRTGILHDRH